MRKVIVNNSLTLDGVMQGPGRSDEDTRDGFEHGGWAQPYADEVMARMMGEGISNGGTLLLGRRTYEDFAEVWPTMPAENPYTAVMNNFRKYVASTTLTGPLSWANSTLLEGDAADAIAKLKEQPGDDLVVLGSGELIRSLMRRNLIDEYVLLIHPLILGSGRRLFADGSPYGALRLVNSTPTTTGVLIARYQPVAPNA